MWKLSQVNPFLPKPFFGFATATVTLAKTLLQEAPGLVSNSSGVRALRCEGHPENLPVAGSFSSLTWDVALTGLQGAGQPIWAPLP